MHMPELALAFGETVSQLSILPASGIGSVLVLKRTWTNQHACLVNTLSSVSLNPTVWLNNNSWIWYKFSCLQKAWLKSMRAEVLNSCSRLAFFTRVSRSPVWTSSVEEQWPISSRKGKGGRVEQDMSTIPAPGRPRRGHSGLHCKMLSQRKKGKERMEKEGKKGKEMLAHSLCWFLLCKCFQFQDTNGLKTDLHDTRMHINFLS